MAGKSSIGQAEQIVDNPVKRLGGVDIDRCGRSFLAPIRDRGVRLVLSPEASDYVAERTLVSDIRKRGITAGSLSGSAHCSYESLRRA